MDHLLTDDDLRDRGYGSRVTRWRGRRDNRFPKPINIGSKDAPRLRWPSDEIEAYERTLRAGGSQEEAVQAAMRVRAQAVAELSPQRPAA